MSKQAAYDGAIYALHDPDTLQIRYVGQTRGSVNGRYKAHVDRAKRGCTTHRSTWIRSLLSRGSVPAVCVLEEGQWTIDQMNQREGYWIQFGWACGWALTNHTMGGDSIEYDEAFRKRVSEATSAKYKADPTNRIRARQSMIDGGHYVWDDEKRLRHSEIMREVMSDPGVRARLKEGLKNRPPLTDAHKKAISVAQKGRETSEETREKLRQARLGKSWITPEGRARISEVSKGRKKTPEEIEKTRSKNFGRKRTPEQRARMSAAQKGRKSPQEGKPWTEEQKEKARASHRARWERYRAEGRDKEIARNISEGMKRKST